MSKLDLKSTLYELQIWDWDGNIIAVKRTHSKKYIGSTTKYRVDFFMQFKPYHRHFACYVIYNNDVINRSVDKRWVAPIMGLMADCWWDESVRHAADELDKIYNTTRKYDACIGAANNRIIEILKTST